jgi:hypothetical protein
MQTSTTIQYKVMSVLRREGGSGQVECNRIDGDDIIYSTKGPFTYDIHDMSGLRDLQPGQQIKITEIVEVVPNEPS